MLNYNSMIKGKANKSDGLFQKFQPILPRVSFLTMLLVITRSFCSYLDHTDVIYDQPRKVEAVEPMKKSLMGNFIFCVE